MRLNDAQIRALIHKLEPELRKKAEAKMRLPSAKKQAVQMALRLSRSARRRYDRAVERATRERDAAYAGYRKALAAWSKELGFDLDEAYVHGRPTVVATPRLCDLGPAIQLASVDATELKDLCDKVSKNLGL